MNKKRLWISIICSLILLWLLVYSCTSRKPSHPEYYTIGRNVSWYPLQPTNRERNFLGFVNDLMDTISKEKEFKYEWIDTGPNNLLTGLDAGRFNAVLTFLRPSEVTKEKYDFSNLIYQTGPVLVVRQDSTIHSLDDLDGKIVGISAGMTYILITALKKPEETNYLLSSFENMNKALDTLVNGKIDAVLMDVLPAHTYIETFYPDLLKVITPPLTDEGLRLISLRNGWSENLIKKFNEGLKKIKQNGTFQSLLNKWQLIDPMQYQRPSNERIN